MKFGCTLETVNVKDSGPNTYSVQTRTYWVDLLKFIAATAFKGIEMPYSPYTADPLAFEVGRAGSPICKFAIDSQYGGAGAFLKMLDGFGIDEIIGLHVSATDTMLDIVARVQDVNSIYTEYEKLAAEAILYAKELKAPVVVLSPSLEIGFVRKNYEDEDIYRQKTKEVVERTCAKGKEHGVKIAVRNEFWSVFRGANVRYMLEIEGIYYSPDTAQLKIAGEDFCSLVNEYADRILLPKFSDTDFVDSENNYKRPHAELPDKGNQRIYCDMGDGGVAFSAARKALMDIGYDGWVVCESKGATDIYKALLKMGWMVNYGAAAKGA